MSIHPDDVGVARFAAAMKAELAACRLKGRGGWDNRAECDVEDLAAGLVTASAKGDPVDLANYAMMLHARGAASSVLGDAMDAYASAGRPVKGAFAADDGAKLSRLRAENARLLESLLAAERRQYDLEQKVLELALDRLEAGGTAKATAPALGAAPAAVEPPAAPNTQQDTHAAIYARRRAQLRMLIDQRTAGNVVAFADQFDYSRSRVSQFLSESYNDGRSIGERAARAMEEAAGLPLGWLDDSAPAPAAAPDESATVHETLVLILRELRMQAELQRRDRLIALSL